MAALHSYLEKYNIELHIVEIAGAGSPYAFAKQEKEVSSKLNWHILFPNGKMEELKSRVIKKQVDRILDILLPDVVIAGAIAFPSGALSVAWTSRHKCKMICFDDSRLEDTVRSSWVNKINSVSIMVWTQCYILHLHGIIQVMHGSLKRTIILWYRCCRQYFLEAQDME